MAIHYKKTRQLQGKTASQFRCKSLIARVLRETTFPRKSLVANENHLQNARKFATEINSLQICDEMIFLAKFDGTDFLPNICDGLVVPRNFAINSFVAILQRFYFVAKLRGLFCRKFASHLRLINFFPAEFEIL